MQITNDKKQQEHPYLSLLSLLYWNIRYIIIIWITAFVTFFIGPLKHYNGHNSNSVLMTEQMPGIHAKAAIRFYWNGLNNCK